MRDKSLGLRKLLSQKLAEAKLPSVTDEQVAQQFKNVIRDALKNNPNLASGLANLTSSIDSAVAAVPAKEDKKAIDTAINSALKAMPSTKVPDLDLQALMETKYEFQEKGQDQQLAELAAQGGYNIPKEDIIEDNKEDIFKMISIRYFKSAYPVFFQEDKTEAKKESKKKK